MLIPCHDIARIIEDQLRNAVQTSPQKITLLAYLLGESPEQLSFVTIKRRLAERLEIGFDFNHFVDIPPVDRFLQQLQEKMQQPQNTGVIIQHPLPPGYDKETIYKVVPPLKEIEGHHSDSPFQFPLSLAVLTGIKYIFGYDKVHKPLDHHIIVNVEQDMPFFREALQGKNIVIAGRGSTGGKPIGECLDEIGIPFQIVHSQTSQPEQYFRQADIIITATGKKILTADMLKQNVILLNVGLRKENGKLRGDYDEEEIKNIASYYTRTPGGLGPLDVLYLYKNIIDAATINEN